MRTQGRENARAAGRGEREKFAASRTVLGLDPTSHTDAVAADASVALWRQITVNVPELVALPPAVVILTFPVTAPVGTVAVTCVPEFTVKTVALTPPKVTLLAPVSPVPVIVT